MEENKIRFIDSIFFKILEDDIPGVTTTSEGIANHFKAMSDFILNIPKTKIHTAYGPTKWTIAELIGHLIDTQTVMFYRILNIGRGEKISLPGFDENLWVANGFYQTLSPDLLVEMYSASANHIQIMLKTVKAEAWENIGTANGIQISTREVLIYLMAHELHHKKIIVERYL